jgi:hypothetical protein
VLEAEPGMAGAAKAAVIAVGAVVLRKITELIGWRVPLPRTKNPSMKLSHAVTYPGGFKVEVAPGEEVAPWPVHLPMPVRIGVFEMIEEADGRFRPVMRLHSTWVRMTMDVTERLGLGTTYASLRRLIVAGFVKGRQLTPNSHSFCIQSFFQHVERVRADPEFWTGENLRRYQQALP